MAVGQGFEPWELAFAGFQDRYFRPLSHPTAMSLFSARLSPKQQAELYMALRCWQVELWFFH